MPYAPGIQDQSGELLAHGLNQFGSGIGRGLEALGLALDKRKEEQKRILQNGKIAESFAKANPDVLQSLGITPEEFSAQSAQDKASMVTGAIQAAGFAEQNKQMQLKAAQIQELGLANQQRQGDIDADYLVQRQVDTHAVSPRMKAMLADLTGPTMMPMNFEGYASGPAERMEAGSPRSAPTPEDLQRYVVQSGMRPERQLQMSQALQNYAQLAPEPYMGIGEIKDLPGGGRLIGKGKGSPPQFESDLADKTEPDEPGGLSKAKRDIVTDKFAKLNGDPAVRNYMQALGYHKALRNQVMESRKTPTGANDISIIFAYMKSIDPSSTVREGEAATAQNSGSVPENLIAKYNNILKGSKLTQDQRENFLSSSGRNVKGHAETANLIRERYVNQLKRFGIPEEFSGDAFDVPDDGSEPVPAGAAGAAQPAVKPGAFTNRFTDRSGAQYRYVGKGNPATDRNPESWELDGPVGRSSW